MLASVAIGAENRLGVSREQLRQQAEQMASAGRPHEAMTLYRLLLRLDTEDAAAYQRIVEIAATAEIRDPQQELDLLAKLFPDGTKLRKTQHFLIVYNTSDAYADSRARLLEQAYEAFFKKMRSAGLRPLPIQQRMVAIVFDRMEDYLQYARNTQNIDVRGTAGYYSAMTNRIAMFNSQSSPQFAEQTQQIARLEQQIQELDRQITEVSSRGDQSAATRLRTLKFQAVNKLSELRNGFHRAAGLNNIAQTFHETAHQLAYNSDIQWFGAAYPFWYSEGLATNFETINPAVPFGPGEENYPRKHALRQTARRDKLTPLTTLVTQIQAPEINDRADWYGQAWGLFYWLYKTKPEQLRKYRALLNQRGGAATTETLKEDFETAFGPIADVEPQWRSFVGSLR